MSTGGSGAETLSIRSGYRKTGPSIEAGTSSAFVSAGFPALNQDTHDPVQEVKDQQGRCCAHYRSSRLAYHRATFAETVAVAGRVIPAAAHLHEGPREKQNGNHDNADDPWPDFGPRARTALSLASRPLVWGGGTPPARSPAAIGQLPAQSRTTSSRVSVPLGASPNIARM